LHYRCLVDVTTIILITLIVSLGNGVQATIGFGAGLVAIPLLLWSGLTLPEAIAVLAASVLVQLSFKVTRYWSEINWPQIWPMAGARLVGYLPGFIILYYLAHTDPTRVKQVMGAVVLLAVVIQVCLRVKPKEKVAGIWTALAGFFSGLGAGAVGVGGPPVVLWVMAHDWSSKAARLYLWTTFWLLMPIGMVPLFWMHDEPLKIGLYMGLGVVLTPAALLGTAGGLWLGHQLPKQTLRILMVGFLLMLGAWSVVGPFVIPR